MSKINLREALINLDIDTDFRYSLTELYEACDLKEEEKNKLVKMISAPNPNLAMVNSMLSSSAGMTESLPSDDIEDEDMPEDVKAEKWEPSLVDCPACGDISFDSKKGYCKGCSYREAHNSYEWDEEAHRKEILTDMADDALRTGAFWDLWDRQRLHGHYGMEKERKYTIPVVTRLDSNDDKFVKYRVADEKSGGFIEVGFKVVPDSLTGPIKMKFAINGPKGMTTHTAQTASEIREIVTDALKDAQMSTYDLTVESLQSFKPGDYVWVKPSKKTGRVAEVKGDYITVEIDGGNDPDRRDVFYPSDLKLHESYDNLEDYTIEYYLNTAAAERRPTTPDDEKDYIVDTFAAEDDYDAAAYAISLVSRDDIDDVKEYYPNLAACLTYFKDADWGDGSPFVVKLVKGNEVVYDSGASKEEFFDDIELHENHDNLEESWWEPKYDENEWEPEDIELHKSIDWKARNYRDYPVPEDSITARAFAYGLPGGTQQKEVKFIKYIRANQIYPPYYGVEQRPFEGVLSGMYDGDKYGKYMIMNRFETQDVYDALSESLEGGQKISRELYRVYDNLLDILYEGSNADVVNNVKAAFEYVGGSAAVSAESNSYIRFNGSIPWEGNDDYVIRGSISLSRLNADFNMLAEDLTMAYYRAKLGGRLYYTSELIKLIKNHSDVELGNGNLKESAATATRPSISYVLSKNMDKLTNCVTPNEFRDTIMKLVTDAEVDPKEIQKLQRALYSKKSVSALWSTIGTYMTGIKVSDGDNWKDTKNESKSISEDVQNTPVKLSSEYFYDTIKNIEDAGWSEILSFAEASGWINGNNIIIPAGTVMTLVDQNKHFDVYWVKTNAGDEFIPFNKDFTAENPLSFEDAMETEPLTESQKWVQVDKNAGSDPNKYSGNHGRSWVTKDSKNIDTWDSKEAAIEQGKKSFKSEYEFGIDWDVVQLQEAYVENPREFANVDRPKYITHWTQAYKEFQNAIKDIDIYDTEAIEATVENLYNEHKGEFAWDQAWIRWLEPADPENYPSEEDENKAISRWEAEKKRIGGYGAVNESFANTLTPEQMEKIENVIDRHTPLMQGSEWRYVDELMDVLNISSKSDIMSILVDYLGFELSEAEEIVDDVIEFRNGGSLKETNARSDSKSLRKEYLLDVFDKNEIMELAMAYISPKNDEQALSYLLKNWDDYYFDDEYEEWLEEYHSDESLEESIENAGKPEEESIALKEAKVKPTLYYHSASDKRNIPVFIKEVEPGKFKWEDESGQSDNWFETEEIAHKDFVKFIQNEIPDVVIEESLSEPIDEDGLESKTFTSWEEAEKFAKENKGTITSVVDDELNWTHYVHYKGKEELKEETSKEWEHRDKDGKIGRIRQSDGKGDRKLLTRDQAKEIMKFRGHEDDELYAVNESVSISQLKKLPAFPRFMPDNTKIYFLDDFYSFDDRTVTDPKYFGYSKELAEYAEENGWIDRGTDEEGDYVNTTIPAGTIVSLEVGRNGHAGLHPAFCKDAIFLDSRQYSNLQKVAGIKKDVPLFDTSFGRKEETEPWDGASPKFDESKSISEERVALKEDNKKLHSLKQDVQTAIYHLVHDLGRDPESEDFAEDVVLTLEKEFYEDEIPSDPLKYREWASAIMCEVSRQLNFNS